MADLRTSTDIITLLQEIERRSRQAVSGQSTQHDPSSERWTGIGFRLADMFFLAPLDHSREVLPLPTQITSVPKAQPWIYGVANIRGDLLPLIDLKLFLQGETSQPDKRSRIMILNHPSLYSGLLVDEVFGLKHFQRPPAINDPTLHMNIRPYLQGTLRQQDRLWYVLNFHKLADDPRFINAAA
ncbi:type IV pili signal transduction protein PilI [Methylophaga frappieri]|uniref:Type IV pili signal transduction protein PilI n=1 Tax=Methylophaga frappieri (strain ATCC BAA-2434 / DSM 25690 / JAM7) TaxID=754477 RepID=I1YJ14_METFJ|nr:chemotaxis protein CheW [Methylophaga frappieri]AFJ02907.1 type IV pili signal transduction protein PilI [Methylophaga frappieri]